MTKPDPSFSVNVDPTNPGQVFACCGLLDLAHHLSPTDGIEGWFADSMFSVAVARGGEKILKRVLEGLCDTQVTEDGTRGDRATHPVLLGRFDITLDWWIDDRGRKTSLKLWAGQQTSLRIVTDLRDALTKLPNVQAKHLFSAPQPLTGRFGIDPRAAWNAIDVGFSPNEQGMEVATFPAVELLAAVGLQRFRPVEDENACLKYSTWSVPLPASVASAAIARLVPGGDMTTYRFRIATRGSYKGLDYAVPAGEQT